MNDSFDLPSEPRLSNSALKNRPIPPNVRTRMKQKNQKAVKIGLDDAVPLDGKYRFFPFFFSITTSF
jgi:hypothetical protein